MTTEKPTEVIQDKHTVYPTSQDSAYSVPPFDYTPEQLEQAVSECLDAADYWYKQGNHARAETYSILHREIKSLQRKNRMLEALYRESVSDEDIATAVIEKGFK